MVDVNLEEFDPKAAQTMRTLNGVGLSIEEMGEQAHNDVRTRKGVIAGMVATQPLVDRVIAKLQSDIDSEKVDAATARLVIAWLEKVKDEIGSSVLMNQRDLAIQESIIEGLKRASSKCEALYKQEEAKVRVRMNESERGNRDEDGRPLPIRARRRK